MRLAIIGGGAAGLMAAATALETNPEAEIVLLERNDQLGKKVLISGGGRCNVTTGLEDVAEILKRYPRGGKFLNSAMRAFPPTAVRAWFEARGIPTKVEADGRVFPVSDNGHDVVGAFEKVFRDAGHVQVRLKTGLKSVTRTADGFRLTLDDGSTLDANRLIITTGGQAFRQTGSTGDGYAFAEALGHHLTPLAPSLSSLQVREEWPKVLAGVSLPYAELTARGAQKHVAAGPFVFTHRGLSGPAVFALSSLIAFEKFDAAHPIPLEIDFRPDENHAALAAKLAVAIQENPHKEIKNLVGFLVPKSLAEVVVSEIGLDGEKPANEIAKKDLNRIVEWLKRVPLTVTTRGGGEEFVTAGGVDLAEVDPRTLQSKIVPGLFFAGEILDIDGFTGGFNLQSAWATGHAAGTAAANL